MDIKHKYFIITAGLISLAFAGNQTLTLRSAAFDATNRYTAADFQNSFPFSQDRVLNNSAPVKHDFLPPISQAEVRVIKKHFGQLIEAGKSPVINDRFSGYHVGVDFETFEDEQDAEVPIFAICDGPLIMKKFAGGYGGLAIQSCRIENENVAIIYGHLDLETITAQQGEEIHAGQQIGYLGQGYSPETDGVRKHLHLGIHKGAELDIRGYVQNADEIGQWLDAEKYLK